MTPRTAATKRRVLARDATLVLLTNLAVGLLLLLFGLAATPQAAPGLRAQALVTQMVFAQAIGFSIFGLIEWPRLTLWWQRPPGWLRLGVVTALAIPTGYVAGNVLGSLLMRLPCGDLVSTHPAVLIALLATVLASLVAVHLVTQRDRLEAERLRAENADMRATSARLQLLQQQIEPHMLFNTLANLHALIDEEPARAQQLLEALSELLHASMQAGERPMVALRQEFDLLENYLRLMAIRMGPRLRYTLVLPAALEQVRVPPLSLQPLVENAVKHGLDAQVAGGHVQVVARNEGGCLLVDVVDDGRGLQASDPFAAGRIGLANLRRRLDCLFGAQAGLQLVDNLPHGVRATLAVPMAAIVPEPRTGTGGIAWAS